MFGVASIPGVGAILERSIVPAAAHIAMHRAKRGANDETVSLSNIELARRISPELRVLHGPFQGLRYPKERSHGSTLISKLVGCYESEIQVIVEEFCNTDYAAVLDIGCAEGFYAVGFAQRLSEARVLAIDIEPAALKLCEEMAKLNGVQERVAYSTALDWAWLDRLADDDRALIVSDCEGYELQAFDAASIDRIARHDVLIETHDFIDPSISRTLRARFDATHFVSEVWSLHDCFRATVCGIPELLEFDLQTRWRIVQEGRPKTMSWLIMRSRSQTNR